MLFRKFKSAGALFMSASLLFIFQLSALGQRPGMNRAPSDYPPAHDPVVAFCEGKYYLFTTGYGVGVMSSVDMKTWKMEKSGFWSKVSQWHWNCCARKQKVSINF